MLFAYQLQGAYSRGMKRVGVVVILFLAFCGLADSAYLAQHEVDGTPLYCNIQHLTGCNIVATSEYSLLFGIPLAQYGVLFYSILFVLSALELVLFDQLLRRLLQITSFIGVIASLYFISVQIFLIQAFCMYCLASAIIAFLVCVIASFLEPIRLLDKESPSSSQPSPHLPMPPEA